MNIFKTLKKYLLEKEDAQQVIDVVENSETLVRSIVPQEEEITFESDSLTSISEGHFLDTTSPLSIAKYKNNLKLLVERTKQIGQVEQFKIIRDDDHFPYDWEWRAASKNTGIEKTGSYLAYEIKYALAMQALGFVNDGTLRIPPSDKVINEEISKIERSVGMIYSPVHFRSTKHFTVNTPLAYTGEYNMVEAERNFTIIDDVEPFLNSGYGYSADYRDAYLDVTHESLKISQNAIVLIAEDKYRDIMNDPVVASQLHERQVIVYRGDESVAINMVLTEQGVLPARPGNRYMMYDNEIRDILENSMRELCANNGLEYAKGHGNMFGTGGHFSDLYDGYNNDHLQANIEFITFLEQKFPECSISSRVVNDRYAAENLIKAVGIDRLLSVIDEYNNIVQSNFQTRFEQYKDDRMTITPDVSEIFKRTVSAIQKFYLTEQDKQMPLDDMYRLKELIRLFYHADTVENQLLAAEEICAIFGIAMTTDSIMTQEVTIK